MYGFKTRDGAAGDEHIVQADRAWQGGRVSGPGTGTSDSVATTSREGSYIMPADSTRQMGLGKPLPVNLSNGEFELPPEQVHALGVAVLNLLKGMTHKGGGHGFRAEDGELYFAGGGVTSASDDELRRQREQAAAGRFAPAFGAAGDEHIVQAGEVSPRAANQIPGMSAGNQAAAQRLEQQRTAAQRPAGRFAPAFDAGTSGQRSLVGEKIIDPIKGFFSDSAAAARGQGSYDDLRAQRNPPPPATTSAAEVGAQKISPPGVVSQPVPSAVQDRASVAAAPAASAAPQGTDMGNGITRIGNSFSGGSGGFQTVDQIQRERQQRQSLMADNLSAINGARAANADLHQTRLNMMDGRPLGWNPSQQQQVSAGSGSNWLAERERQNMINRVLTPHAGAQNRQLTMGQMRLATDLMQSGQVSEEARVREQGLADRAMLAEQGAAARSADSTALARQSLANDTRRLAGEEQARGFDIRARERIESLYDRYDTAETPEQRSSIAEQLRVLSGKGNEQPNRFTVVPGGQVVDPETYQLVTMPSMVLNNQTGQFMPQQSAMPQQPAQGSQALEKGRIYTDANGNQRKWDGENWVTP